MILHTREPYHQYDLLDGQKAEDMPWEWWVLRPGDFDEAAASRSWTLPAEIRLPAKNATAVDENGDGWYRFKTRKAALEAFHEAARRAGVTVAD